MNLDPLNLLVGFFKLLLYPFSILYGAIMWLRNKWYDNGVYSSIEFNLPVICVGNLSTGGTGKTPHIEYLVRLLQYEYRLATQSRGYKRRTQGFRLAEGSSTAREIGDEPMQFHLKFPDLVVSVCEERMTGIPTLLSKRPDVDVILLDDAFQHRSVKAGFNVLITDFSKPFYEDFILPFGSLREQRSAYKRAQAIIVSKCPIDLGEEKKKEIFDKINPQEGQNVYFTAIQYGKCYNFFTSEQVELKSTDAVVMVSGIAKPEPMLKHIKDQVSETHLLRYPDHHYFTESNLAEIKQTSENWNERSPIIVTTEKDATRLALKRDELESWNIPIYVLPIEIIFLENKGKFDESVYQYVLGVRGMNSEEIFEEIF